MNQHSQRIMLFLVILGIGLVAATHAAAADDRDACAMLKKGDVEAAFAPRKFDSGKPGVSIKSSKSMAAVSNCTYTSKGAKTKDMIVVTLGVRRAPSDKTGITPEAAKVGSAQLKAIPKDVAGLGDSAYWIALSGGIQLNVFNGKREWLTFGSRAKMLENDKIVANLTNIAKATLVH